MVLGGRTNWKKYYFIQEVRPKCWFSTHWATKCVKSGVSWNQWFSTDLDKSVLVGSSSASWSCLCVQLLCWWHQAGCQADPLQQSIMTWSQMCNTISSTITMWELLLWVYKHPCLHYVCALKPLFSLPHRGRKSSKRGRLPLCLIAGAYPASLAQRNPWCQLSLSSYRLVLQFVRCNFSASLCTRWWWCITAADWQNISYQRTVKEGVSQCVARRPQTSLW